MSDTPRTDGHTYWNSLPKLATSAQIVYADFARTLERELSTATAALAAAQKDLRDWCEHAISDTSAAELTATKKELAEANAERAKLLGYYHEIVAAIGHDCILKEYNQRGELLRQESQWRKESEEQLRAALERVKELEGAFKEIYPFLSQISGECCDGFCDGSTVQQWERAARRAAGGAQECIETIAAIRAAARPDAG